MSTQVQLRRGTAAQHATFVGAPGEVTVVTDDNTIRVHDGVTPGGHEVSDADLKQAFNAHLAETSHKHINESGTNANGSYIRFDDGTQFCWFTTEIGYLEPARLRKTWSYPASFQEDPTITLSTRVVPANVTPSEDEIGSPQIGNPSASSVNLIVWRIKGLTDFEDGDFVYGFVTAFGRWK